MALWIEENLVALFVGAGLGAIIAHAFNPTPLFWMLGSLAGIGLALPIWQIINRSRRS